MSDFQIHDPEIEKTLKSLGRYLKAKMPSNMGYTLLMHTIGEGGATFYISSIERADAYAAMKDFLVKQGQLDPAAAATLEVPGDQKLPPQVRQAQAAAMQLIKLCVETQAPMMLLKLGGVVGFGVPVSTHWEIEVRRKS